MTTQVWDTPDPVHLTVELGTGTVRIAAAGSGSSMVRISPQDSGQTRDVRAAAAARVSYAGGKLAVCVPHAAALPYRGGAVRAEIRVPAGSAVDAAAVSADIEVTGRAGVCALATGCGHLRAADTAGLRAGSLLGHVTAGRVRGGLEAAVECGDLTVERVDGPAHARDGHGATWIGEACGELTVLGGEGEVYVGRARGAVRASTGSGEIRIGEAARGPLQLHSASGDLHVGIAAGASPRMELRAAAGTVYQALDLLSGAGRAAPGAEGVRVWAHTGFGDILVCRTTPGPA